MEKEQKVIYYSDELNDEFSGDNIVTKRIDGEYRYTRNRVLDKICHIFFYRIIAIPLAFLYMKIHFRHKIVNRKVLKQMRGKRCYIYGNHTHFLADALIPTMVSFPKKISVIVHPNNVSMPVLGRITPYLGALPLPDEKQACKHFVEAIGQIMKKNGWIMIYPEAHIWPFYTDIRPFKDTSFRYPVQYQTPVFSLTNTYQKRRFSKNPRIVTYIDGPFYPDRTKVSKEQKLQLRNQVYESMKERAKQNNVELVRYIKVEKKKEEKDD
ncbi:lysophospholipid acyltransferase family protein [Roseburia sp. 499]|uniref:lysophospholipid acyltransferase family protein n=1 Tax=Roseburia sp. 499 TaxID=1261634 RepID=UPI0009521431|nr:1-acyl-sn-glycerol-3-phosphate acyltransferase [Roseburia sp. 499]WVK70466.1 hypothetical protein BIV20_02760 [Roseburia sp. 499]